MSAASSEIIRFAPSPTGQLHLGHVYSAIFCYHQAQKLNARFLLRIEDIDPQRCKPEYEAEIYDFLSWLGLEWEQPVRRQSDHMDLYEQQLNKLIDMGLAYPCICSRKQIRSAHDQLNEAGTPAKIGADGPHYPGTCRPELTGTDEAAFMALAQNVKQQIAQLDAEGIAYNTRLNADAVRVKLAETELYWEECHSDPIGLHKVDLTEIDDLVLARKDIKTSYNLSVITDDNLQGITLVTRGEDLRGVTPIHRLLQHLLGFQTPRYIHHSLLYDETGEKLAKRKSSQAMQELRDQGISAAELRTKAGVEALYQEALHLKEAHKALG